VLAGEQQGAGCRKEELYCQSRRGKVEEGRDRDPGRSRKVTGNARNAGSSALYEPAHGRRVQEECVRYRKNPEAGTERMKGRGEEWQRKRQLGEIYAAHMSARPATGTTLACEKKQCRHLQADCMKVCFQNVRGRCSMRVDGYARPVAYMRKAKMAHETMKMAVPICALFRRAGRGG